MRCEITAKLLDSNMLDTFLNSVNTSFKCKSGGIVTAVVAKERYHTVTKNQTQQRPEHSAGSHPSNTVIKVILDSGSDGDLMFHEKGTPIKHSPYLARQVPTFLHTSNGNFLTNGRSEVNIKFLNARTARSIW